MIATWIEVPSILQIECLNPKLTMASNSVPEQLRNNGRFKILHTPYMEAFHVFMPFCRMSLTHCWCYNCADYWRYWRRRDALRVVSTAENRFGLSRKARTISTGTKISYTGQKCSGQLEKVLFNQYNMRTCDVFLLTDDVAETVCVVLNCCHPPSYLPPMPIKLTSVLFNVF